MPRNSWSAHIVKELNAPDSNLMKQLCSDYEKVFSKVSPLNATADQPFESDMVATYHFIKHGKYKRRELTPEDFFDQVKELFNAKITKIKHDL